jgi:hypothetical protein
MAEVNIGGSAYLANVLTSILLVCGPDSADCGGSFARAYLARLAE